MVLKNQTGLNERSSICASENLRERTPWCPSRFKRRATRLPGLFPDPVTHYYGFNSSIPGRVEGSATKNAFCLRYHDVCINRVAVDNNRTSEIALYVVNLPGTPSGTKMDATVFGEHPAHRRSKLLFSAPCFALTHWTITTTFLIVLYPR